MQIDNMTPYDVDDVQAKLAELTQTNAEIESRVYPMEDQPTNAKIFEKLEAIEIMLKHIFDGHVLIDGEFKIKMVRFNN